MEMLDRYHRYEFKGTPVYIDPLRPDWFVPSSRGDELLQVPGGSLSSQDREELARFRHLLIRKEPLPYKGRAALLGEPVLKELWFHLTDTCNLACRHCLFAASPKRKTTLAEHQLHAALDEAVACGCRLFYFTGGEPFVYPDFPGILARVLDAHPDSHVVVLTNGTLLAEHRAALAGLDGKRLHLQVSLDGPEEEHDRLRGRGSFVKLRDNLDLLRAEGIALTVSTAVNRDNASQLPGIAELAADFGAQGLHLMFHFIRGKGSQEQFVEPQSLLEPILEAVAVCRQSGLVLDNLESFRSQVFTLPGTRHDLSNMGWESMAIGPDGWIYPSPALIGFDQLACGEVEDGLEKVLLHSPVLAGIRKSSLVDTELGRDNDFVFFTGGGDPDHSWMHGGDFAGHDPYHSLYEQLMLALIAEQAGQYPDRGLFRLRMGDVRYDCPQEEGREVVLTHCNCVLSLAGGDGRSSVRAFYGAAAREANKDIVNPHAPATSLDLFIPEQARERSYGCGSPVRDAAPAPGETVVDLGSGSGVECFLAARETGPEGRVIGIDMTDDMLALAEKARKEVVRELGYDTIEFRRGFLENIPLEDAGADVVISNCVINLSPDKRATYLEILRVLRPGGRMVIADIVTDVPVDARLGQSARFRGECLGGAMQQDDLIQMLEDCGFVGLRLHKRFFYREVMGNRFFSLTYEARKPEKESRNERLRAVYRGPLVSVRTESGVTLRRGILTTVSAGDGAALGDDVFLLDEAGNVVNVEQEAGCCGVAPEESDRSTARRAVPIKRHESGCMVCGEELVYSNGAERRNCHFCGRVEQTNAVCRQAHYVCDGCHQQEAVEVIRHICVESRENDMLALLSRIRSHPRVPMHGPEHHAMVPGVILSACRNNGGPVNDEEILAGIGRGGKVPGGACGFWGSCGAAVGAGIAAALILDATPLTPHPRQKAQEFTARVLASIAEITGGRCCQRETWLALRQTAELSGEYFGVTLRADSELHCDQYGRNRECIGKQCPLWEGRLQQRDVAVLPLTMAH